jgi:hypothetical protein
MNVDRIRNIPATAGSPAIIISPAVIRHRSRSVVLSIAFRHSFSLDIKLAFLGFAFTAFAFDCGDFILNRFDNFVIRDEKRGNAIALTFKKVASSIEELFTASKVSFEISFEIV